MQNLNHLLSATGALASGTYTKHDIVRINEACSQNADTKTFISTEDGDEATREAFSNILRFSVMFLSNEVATTENDIIGGESAEPILAVTCLLRILSRDLNIQGMLMNLQVAQLFSKIILKSTEITTHEGLHGGSLVKLQTSMLKACEQGVLQVSLHLLAALVQNDNVINELCNTSLVDLLLTHLRTDSNLLTQKLCANLLKLTCSELRVREEVRIYDGIPVLLSTLSVKNLRLQWTTAWTLAQLAEDDLCREELYSLGAVPIIIGLVETCTSKITGSNVTKVDELILPTIESLCALLAQLCLDDSMVQQIVQNNGVYILGKVLVLRSVMLGSDGATLAQLTASVFRVWRLLFSLERNRQLFRRIFTPSLYGTFVDVGTYVLDLSKYKKVITTFTKLPPDELELFVKNIESVNQRREALFRINNYEVLEQLGAGAFGCVYRVRQRDSEHYFAMKEIFTQHTFLGSNADECKMSVGNIIQEVNIIKQQLRHPNVVRYRRIFEEDEKLYVVMDLIQGASLKEYINSLKEKKLRYSEPSIWNLLIQMVLGLSYLHKEKNILHRDLNPNNVMVKENDTIVITDFGLAKQKGIQASKLTSIVGTILYHSPELIQNEPYDERIDIWALGCIIFEMCMLEPAFYSQNMLQLANKIVDANYAPVDSNLYGEQLISVCNKCLTSSMNNRPDINGVAALIADRLLTFIDNLNYKQLLARVQQDKNRYASAQKRNNSASSRPQSLTMTSIANRSRGKTPDTPANGLSTSQTSQISTNSFGFSSSGYENRRIASSSDASLPQIRERRKSGDSRPGSAKLNRPRISRDRVIFQSNNFEDIESSGSVSANSSRRAPAKSEDDMGINLNSSASSLMTKSRTRIPTLKSNSSSNRQNEAPTQPRRANSAEMLPRISSATSTISEIGLNTSMFGQNSRDDLNSGRLPTINRRWNSVDLAEKLRMRSAGYSASLVNVPADQVKMIADPVTDLLDVVHKLFLALQTQSIRNDYRRRILEHFRRNLFIEDSNPQKIKLELKKMSSQSPDIVQMDLGMKDFQPLFQQFSWLSKTSKKQAWTRPVSSKENIIPFITYEQLYCILESVLKDRNNTNIENRPPTALAIVLNPLNTNYT